MKIRIPYGKGFLETTISDNRIAGVITSNLDRYETEESENELIKKAMQHPFGCCGLEKLARDKNKIVIIASDHTRPVPSRLILPLMLEDIKKGNPNAEITILIATGCHRETTHKELTEKFGEEIVNKIPIKIHDCDATDQVYLGKLPSGGELFINKTAADADLLIAEGFIEPHFFAGYSGGRKSVLPGIASRKTIYANHCAEFIADSKAQYGVLEGNPIHEDMIFAARKAGLAYIVNVVINSRHKVIGAFSGDVEAAHSEGVQFLEKLCKAERIKSSIVITSNNGFPMDQNIYQSVKGMATAEACCNEGGVIIMVSECREGCGAKGFYKTFSQEKDSGKIQENILSTNRNETKEDQWQSQIFARIIHKFHVILVSAAEPEIVSQMHLIPADNLEQAMTIADGILGGEKKITIIPEGLTSIIKA